MGSKEVSLNVSIFASSSVLKCYNRFHSDEFKIMNINNPVDLNIERIIKSNTDLVVFQLTHPISNIQNFFVDLIETKIKPILLAFSIHSSGEIVYSITNHQNVLLINKVKQFFTDLIKDSYTCYFNCIGTGADDKNIMKKRINTLEKTEYLKDILRGVTEEEFYYYKKKASLNLNNKGYFLFIVDIMDIEYSDHSLNKNIYYKVGEILIDECKEVLSAYNGGEVFYINPTQLCMIINDIPRKSEATYQQNLREMTNRLSKVTSCKTMSRYESAYIEHIKDIRSAYESIFKLRLYDFFCKDATVLTFELINETRKYADVNEVDAILDQIKGKIEYNIHDPLLIKLMEKLFLDIIKPSLSYDLYYYCFTFLSATLSKFQNSYINNLLKKDTATDRIRDSSIEEKCALFIEIIDILKEDLLTRNQAQNPIVLQAIKIIEECYADNISVHFISKQLNINPSYLSQIFARETGISPQKYLISYRIEKAKELLTETNLTVYMISDEVGYFDPKYFAKSFKKETGLTPTEFREEKQSVNF